MQFFGYIGSKHLAALFLNYIKSNVGFSNKLLGLNSKLIRFPQRNNYTISTRSYTSNKVTQRNDVNTTTNNNGSSSTVQKSTSNEPKDILLYEQTTPEYFNRLNFFSLVQFFFFGVTAFTFGGLRDVPVEKTNNTTTKNVPVSKFDANSSEEQSEEKPFWRNVNLGDKKLKYGLQIGALTAGYVILISGWIYILRSVRWIVLRKDRKTICIVTYAPFGRKRYFDVPMKDISALGSRQDRSMPHMNLQINKAFFRYKLDLTRSRFPDPVLFDSTVGRRRTFN